MMKTEPLYINDSYLKECDSKIIRTITKKEVEEKEVPELEGISAGILGEGIVGIIVDKTIFYPQGGGQPSDKGAIIIDQEEIPVVGVVKRSGFIIHLVNEEPLKRIVDNYRALEGKEAKLIIDWNHRYSLMKAHTASHIISALCHRRFGALITGNQLSIEKIRIDFNLEEFDRERLASVVEEADEIIKKGCEVRISYLSREEALKKEGLVKLANALPPAVKELRIVTIIAPDGSIIDEQADGGTHVNNTREIGSLRFLKADNKGKNNRRLYVEIRADQVENNE